MNICADDWHQRLQPTGYSCPTCKTPSLPTPAHCDGDPTCVNRLECECCCGRCSREKSGTSDRFYCCGNPDHRKIAAAKHLRVFGREPEWNHDYVLSSSIPKSCGGTGDFNPSDELDKIPLGTAEEERQRAKNWFNSYAQESRNASYYRARAKKAESIDVNQQLSLAAEHMDSLNRRLRSLETDRCHVLHRLLNLEQLVLK